MFRFLIGGEEWILRFSPQASFELEEKQAIIQAILNIEKELAQFTHGDYFLVINKNVGNIVFKIERVPSLIVTVCNIIPDERCFFL